MRLIYSFLIFSLLTSIQLFSQERMTRSHGGERIEQFKKVRLMEVMKMDEETSIRFFARYNKYEETMRAIQRDHNDLIDQLQKLAKSHADNPAMEQLIKDIGMCEEKIAETRSKFLEELHDVITVQQIAEYVVFERNFNNNLKEIMRDFAKERWNRPRE